MGVGWLGSESIILHSGAKRVVGTALLASWVVGGLLRRAHYSSEAVEV